MNLEKLLTVDIIPTLTDFLGNQIVFWDAFEKNKSFNTPIKNVLELGVYRLLEQPNSDYPGQSTKTLMALSKVYEVEKFVSLDIDDCSSTIENCKTWLRKFGNFIPSNHKFIQSNSIALDVSAEFPNGIDLIFLDTCHDDNYPERIGYPNSGGAGMTYKEICYYAHHLTENGRLFLHDTKNYYLPRAYGVNTEGAIQKFLNENPNFGFHEHDTNIHGLGQIYRKGSLIEGTL
jgi:hypothetical protein